MKLNKYIVYWDCVEKDFTVIKINEGSELPKEFSNFNQVLPWASGICAAVCVDIDDIGTPEKTEILGQSFAVNRAYDLFKQFFSHSFDDIDCAREKILQRTLKVLRGELNNSLNHLYTTHPKIFNEDRDE